MVLQRDVGYCPWGLLLVYHFRISLMINILLCDSIAWNALLCRMILSIVTGLASMLEPFDPIVLNESPSINIIY